jgi:monofunctional biosynthetic peptidoglycan transglycosylase
MSWWDTYVIRVFGSGRAAPGKRITWSSWSRALMQLALALVGVTVLQVEFYRWVPPPVTAFMLESRVEARASGEGQWQLRYRWIGWDEMAPSSALAVVAAEDQKFPTHRGFDIEAISDAWDDYREGGRQRGGSTITQQVARNLYLWRGGGFFRKGLEAYYTVLIEALWPKRRILEVYLNVAEFGDGVYGVGAASEVFFKKDASELTRRESALLAAVLPSPKRMHAERPSPYVEKRAQKIMHLMDQLGSSYLGGLWLPAPQRSGS